MIDVIGEIDQTQEYHDHRDNAVQQTLTQLNQMRDKRLSIFYRHVYGLSLDEGKVQRFSVQRPQQVLPPALA